MAVFIEGCGTNAGMAGTGNVRTSEREARCAICGTRLTISLMHFSDIGGGWSVLKCTPCFELELMDDDAEAE